MNMFEWSFGYIIQADKTNLAKGRLNLGFPEFFKLGETLINRGYIRGARRRGRMTYWANKKRIIHDAVLYLRNDISDPGRG